jgi:glycosyltransferase involved in cell wall biosynthesis
MKILVIVPTMPSRAELLKEAIESLEGQTRKADEIVVRSNIDDRGAPIGLAERYNEVLEQSDCDAFLVLCDDDKLDPCYIQKTVDVMEREKVDIVYTDCHIFGDRNMIGHALGEWNRDNIERNTVPLVTSLCKRSAWKKAGGFSSVPFIDWDFWWKCFYTGATAYWLKEPLFWWRDHAGQGSRTENWEKSRQFILNRHDELRSVMA